MIVRELWTSSLVCDFCLNANNPVVGMGGNQHACAGCKKRYDRSENLELFTPNYALEKEIILLEWVLSNPTKLRKDFFAEKVGGISLQNDSYVCEFVLFKNRAKEHQHCWLMGVAYPRQDKEYPFSCDKCREKDTVTLLKRARIRLRLIEREDEERFFLEESAGY